MKLRKSKSDYFSTKRKIQKLKELTDNKAQPSKFIPLIRSIFNNVTVGAQTIRNKHLFRSRWNINNSLFTNVKDLKYKPSNEVDKKGRLNDVNESILYAAACELGTILESRPEIDKIFTICKIECLNPNLYYFPIGDPDKQIHFNSLSPKEKIVITYCNNEITKQIRNPEDYNSTIALGRFFLKTGLYDGKTNQGSCLIYPSVAGSQISNQKTYNVAILPKIFESNFQVVEAIVYCLSNEGTHYQLNPLNKTVSISKFGDFNWKFNVEIMKNRISKGLLLDDKICESIKGIKI